MVSEEFIPKKIIIITAPSGSGKTTIVTDVLKHFSSLAFSISACTRKPRANEQDGLNYYFITPESFQQKINEDAFVEYEMVYEGKYYGTLKLELERIWNNKQFPLVDIDVQGAIRILGKEEYECLSLFIKAPSLEELEKRLRARGTETEQTLLERLQKAEHEMSFAHHFHHIIVNDNLERACNEVRGLIATFVA